MLYSRSVSVDYCLGLLRPAPNKKEYTPIVNSMADNTVNDEGFRDFLISLSDAGAVCLFTFKWLSIALRFWTLSHQPYSPVDKVVVNI